MRIVCMTALTFLLIACESVSQKTLVLDNCWDYIDAATDLRREKKYDLALVEIEKHNLCDTSDIKMSYFYHKGWTHYEMGNYQGAIDAFSSDFMTQPTYIYAYWRRGMAYEAMGNFERAKEDYHKGYEVGLKKYGVMFFERMNKEPEVKAKLMQNWDA